MVALIRWVRSTLRPQVTLLNLFFYLLSALLSICFFVYVNAAQAFVLTSLARVPVSQLGDATGSLALYDELLSVVAVLAWGFLSDHMGRRSVYAFGFLIIGAATVSTPFARNLYPDLLLTRLAFAVGAAAAASMLTAVLADFVRDKHRGLVAGAVGLVSGLGALLALFVFLPLPISLQGRGYSALASTRLTYGFVAAISFAFGIVLWFCIRPPPPADAAAQEDSAGEEKASVEEREPSNAPANAEADTRVPIVDAEDPVTVNNDEDRSGRAKSDKSFLQLAKEGILAGKNPQVALGYLGGFCARADSIVLTLFITLYVNARYVKRGVCSFDPSAPTSIAEELCPRAYRRGSVLSGVAQTCALVGALAYGGLADRIPRSLTLALAALLGLVGFVLLSVVDSPDGGAAIAAVALMGLGQIGTVVVSLALVTTSEVPADVRGAVAGVYGFSGAVGILLSSRLGGSLFDSWRQVAPFVLMAIIHSVVLLVSVVVWAVSRFRTSKPNESEDGKSEVKEDDIRLSS